MRGGDLQRPKLAPDIEAIRLRDALTALNTKHEFRVGMIVQQKPQASLYKKGDNNLAIVVEILSPPLVSPSNDMNPHYREPLDMIVGTIDFSGTDDFTTFHVDSRRFEPVEGEN